MDDNDLNKFIDIVVSCIKGSTGLVFCTGYTRDSKTTILQLLAKTYVG